jgi:hypothetical protein
MWPGKWALGGHSWYNGQFLSPGCHFRDLTEGHRETGDSVEWMVMEVNLQTRQVWGRRSDLELLCSVAVLYLSVLSFHNKWRVSSLRLFCVSRNVSLLLSWGKTVIWFQWCKIHINSLSAYYWIKMRDNLCKRRAHVWGFWPALEHQSIPVTGEYNQHLFIYFHIP